VTRHQTPPLRRPFFDERDERERRGKRALKPTIEKLGGDCLDVGILRRLGIFGDTRRSWSAFRWPDIAVIRADRYSITGNATQSERSAANSRLVDAVPFRPGSAAMAALPALPTACREAV
jgi:hypothetical protein